MAYVCIECGGEMEQVDDIALVCTECGHSCDIVDYGHEEQFYDIWGSGPDIPEGCAACGGPFPDCTTSCSLFDD